MKVLFAVLLAIVACLGAAQEPRGWLMFFMKGDGVRPTDESKVQEMMKGHLGNMGAQAKAGRLFAAGPLNDPTKERRGITVVWAKDLDEVKSYFKDDPFVKAGIMTVEAFPWDVQKSSFHPDVNPDALGEFRLVTFRRGRGMRPQNAEMTRRHGACLQSLVTAFGPGVRGGIGGGIKSMSEVIIVATKDDAAIKDKLAGSPLIKGAIVEFEILPLWMSRDVLGKRGS